MNAQDLRKLLKKKSGDVVIQVPTNISADDFRVVCISEEHGRLVLECAPLQDPPCITSEWAQWAAAEANLQRLLAQIRLYQERARARQKDAQSS